MILEQRRAGSSSMHKSLTIIREEHRALAAVLHGLQYVVKQLAGGKGTPDFRLLEAMIGYILMFPVRLHHPKEDEHLFRALRARRPSIVPVLEQLEAEHVTDREYAAALQDTLRQFEHNPEQVAAFSGAVDRYAAFQWAHMRKEEEVVLPAAEQALTAADWDTIDAAFASNRDPLVGVNTSEEFRDLFQRIMNAAPAPIGTGQA
jgi:hemerythrin-like domain-containing protein